MLVSAPERAQIQRIFVNAWGRVGNPREVKLRERLAPCCTDVVVNLNDCGDRSFRTFRSLRDYAESFAHFYELGLRVHVMSWVAPDALWIRSMAKTLAELVWGFGVEQAPLLDAEGKWASGFPGSRPATAELRHAARADAAALLRREFADLGLQYGVTDIPMVSEQVLRPLLRGAVYAMPQAHEFGLSLPGSIRRPGRYVAWTEKHWPSRLSPGTELIPHLAAYRRKQTAAGLRASIEAVRAHGRTAFGVWTDATFSRRDLREVLADYKRGITARAAAA